MSKHPFLEQWLSEKWTVGQYNPSETFKQIINHSCVCRPDLGLVAVTGRAEDLESQKMADLFAAAPDLLVAAKVALAWANGELLGGDIKEQLSDAIKKAEGGGE